MTNIELRFFESAVSFFTKKKSKSELRAEIAASVFPSIVTRFTEMDEEVAAKTAVKYADALIKALDDGEK